MSTKPTPHRGLAIAIAAAGGPRALGRIIGKDHSYVRYRFNRGLGLPDDLAGKVSMELKLPLNIVMGNTRP